LPAPHGSLEAVRAVAVSAGSDKVFLVERVGHPKAALVLDVSVANWKMIDIKLLWGNFHFAVVASAAGLVKYCGDQLLRPLFSSGFAMHRGGT
tara:strand:- start:3212 stop:3490 length:279 start_codon:yes stop_codon:yes gene_type:complete